MGKQTATRRSPALEARRLPFRLEGNDRRVITLPFGVTSEERVRELFELVKAMAPEDVERGLAEVAEQFGGRHKDIRSVSVEHARTAQAFAGLNEELPAAYEQLLGSYLTMEYSIEAAALFNPSITPHPDQSNLAPGALRFILSLRATGEGHISSIVFRTGTLDADGRVELNPAPRFLARTRLAPDQRYIKTLFVRKLEDINVNLDMARVVMDLLPEQFTYDELMAAIESARRAPLDPWLFEETWRSIWWLARSNYKLKLAADAAVEDVLIFPHSPGESRGIEDLHLVLFTDDDGSQQYYGTYTAYDGHRILPILMETSDFHSIQIHTLNGACAQNKGMALFPRRIGGHYVMCSRIDGRNLYLMYSDLVHFWESAELLAQPAAPWEYMLMGNCGSPIETPEGWLLVTHGVGPMRRYCIGAMLLDLEDPLRIIGRLREPLLAPVEQEREGYVPNVVYSCGSLVHAGQLYIPYAMADCATGMAAVDLDELIDRLVDSPC